MQATNTTRTTTTVEDILQCERDGSDVLRLRLSRRSNCEALADALRHVTVPTRLELMASSSNANGDEPPWDSHSVISLFEALGRLPHLQSVILQGRASVDNHFPLYLLRSLLVPGRHRLRYLQVNFMQLQLGTFQNEGHQRSARDDTLCLQQALEQMTSLQQVSFHCLSIFEGHRETSELFETHVLKTIARNPSLQRLVLVGKSEAQALDFFGNPREFETRRLLSCAAADAFLQAHHLQEIRLEHLVLPVALMHRIIQIHIHAPSKSSSRLRTLVLGRIPEGSAIDRHSSNGSSLLDNVETLLRVHPSLECLCLHGDAGGGYDRLLCHMAAGLAHNTVLKELQLRSEHMMISHKVQTAFVQALKQNYTLQRISLGGHDNSTVDAIPEMALYLRLNNAPMNRKYFVLHYATVSSQEWIRVLARSYLDLDCVYYFLRLNPQLCHTIERNNTPLVSSSPERSRVQCNHNTATTTINRIRQVLAEQLPASTALTEEQINDIVSSLTSILETTPQK